MTVNKTSQHIDLGRKFVEYMVFDEEHIHDWLGESDIISSLTTIEQNFELGNDFLGGQDYHEVFKQAALKSQHTCHGRRKNDQPDRNPFKGIGF